jgi:hypothetical protein
MRKSPAKGTHRRDATILSGRLHTSEVRLAVFLLVQNPHVIPPRHTRSSVLPCRDFNTPSRRRPPARCAGYQAGSWKNIQLLLYRVKAEI